MKVLKKLMVLVLVLAMTAGLVPVKGAQAATKPGNPAVTVKANDDGKSATITIAKTKNAEGYKIMVLKPGAKKYVKLTTVKKDGSTERTYTAKKLAAGEYKFKVRAYLKSGKKTVWGKYSKVVTVTVGSGTTNDTASASKYISTLDDLKNIDARNSDITYILKNDIDMTGWKEPIPYMFCSIDGAGHTLKNLAVPLAGKVYGGKIENITFELKITTVYELEGYKFVAPIGYIGPGNKDEIATVRNCRATGYIKLEGGNGYDPSNYMDAIFVGGLVGENPNNYGYVEKCVNEANITIKDFSNAAIGGIIGVTGGRTGAVTISECVNIGDIDTDTSKHTMSYCGVGGIAGYGTSSAVTKDCVNLGSVHGSGSKAAGGGITGGGDQRLENCVSLGAADYAVFGGEVDKDIIDSWSYSAQMFTNVYCGSDIENEFCWRGNPVEVKGVQKVSDVTDQSAFKGLDFKNIWEMTGNGPELKNIPK